MKYEYYKLQSSIFRIPKNWKKPDLRYSKTYMYFNGKWVGVWTVMTFMVNYKSLSEKLTKEEAFMELL